MPAGGIRTHDPSRRAAVKPTLDRAVTGTGKTETFWNINPKSVRSYDVSVILYPSAQRHKPEDLNLQKPGSQNLRSRNADLNGTASSIFESPSSHVLKHTRLSQMYAITWPLTPFCTVTYKRQMGSHKEDLTSGIKTVS